MRKIKVTTRWLQKHHHHQYENCNVNCKKNILTSILLSKITIFFSNSITNQSMEKKSISKYSPHPEKKLDHHPHSMRLIHSLTHSLAMMAFCFCNSIYIHRSNLFHRRFPLVLQKKKWILFTKKKEMMINDDYYTVANCLLQTVIPILQFRYQFILFFTFFALLRIRHQRFDVVDGAVGDSILWFYTQSSIILYRRINMFVYSKTHWTIRDDDNDDDTGETKGANPRAFRNFLVSSSNCENSVAFCL